jgi:hypothetical protein
LDIGPDEILGVLFEHIVDLVKDRVHILAEFLSTFLTSGRTIVRLVVATAALALYLLLGHFASRTELSLAQTLLSNPDNQYPPALTNAPGQSG